MQSWNGGPGAVGQGLREMRQVGSDGLATQGANEQSGHPPNERLLKLLRELVAREGRVKAAETLGVNFRTLQQAVDTGVLSARMEDALKRRLLEEGGADGAQTGRRLRELERRQTRLEAGLKTLARELGAQLAGISAELAALRDAAPLAERQHQTECSGEELAGTAPNETGHSPSPVRGVAEPVIGRGPPTRPWRAHPDLVTLEPEAGEELVYGEAAPLIAEWREARAAFIDAGSSRVERATAWVHMSERAVTLIGEHELTLPLADYPWDRFERRRELRRSEQSLRDARRERRRARLWRLLRRILTLGIWRR